MKNENKMPKMPNPVHALIDQEVSAYRRVTEFSDGSDTIIQDHLAKVTSILINMDPKTRRRINLIRAIANLEHLAGCYRDELADGQYNDIIYKDTIRIHS